MLATKRPAALKTKVVSFTELAELRAKHKAQEEKESSAVVVVVPKRRKKNTKLQQQRRHFIEKQKKNKATILRDLQDDHGPRLYDHDALEAAEHARGLAENTRRPTGGSLLANTSQHPGRPIHLADAGLGASRHLMHVKHEDRSEIVLKGKKQTKQLLSKLAQETKIQQGGGGDGDDDSVSSSETRKNKKRRKADSYKSTTAAATSVMVQPHSATLVAAYDKDEMRILSPKALLAEFPEIALAYTHQDEKRHQHKKNPGGSSSQSQKQQLIQDAARAQQEIELERKHPWLEKYMADLINKLPKPEWRFQLGEHPANHDSVMTQSIEQQLRERRLFLPELDALFETEILQQAGTFSHKDHPDRLYNFPECAWGAECVANHVGLRGMPVSSTPVTFMSLMYPDEYANFLKTGVPPGVRRPCILCCRYNFYNFVLGRRHHRDQVLLQTGCVYQLYRNPHGRVGGYIKEAMVLANPEEQEYEGFVDPHAAFLLNRIRVVQDIITGRLRIDQSAMLYLQPPVMNPQIGESRADFCRRSSESHKGIHYYDSTNILVSPSWDVRTPLLRDALPLVSGWQLQQLLESTLHEARRAAASSSQEFSLVLSLDSLVVCANDFFGQYGPLPSSALDPHADATVTGTTGQLHRVIFEDTITSCIDKIPRTCIWGAATKKDLHIWTLGKLLPQKCQTRMFIDVVLSGMATNKAFHDDVLDWVACSLLGNYRYMPPGTRPLDSRVRVVIYRARREFDGALLKDLMRRLPHLTPFILRHYLLYQVQMNPVLLNYLKQLLNWTEFERIVMDVLTKSYAVLYESIHRWSSSSSSASSPEHVLDLSADEIKRIEGPCGAAHDQVLALAYHRAKKPLVKAFPVLRNRLAEEGIYATRILEQHEDCMAKFIERLDPAAVHPSRQLVAFLQSLQMAGSRMVTAEAVTQFANFQRDFDTHMGKKAAHRELVELAKTYPYIYALVNAFATMWGANSWVSVRALPAQYTQYQIMAIQERLGLSDDVVVPRFCELWFCRGCRKLYSNVISFNNKPCKDHGNSWCPRCNVAHEVGNDGMVVDYRNGNKYCRHSHPVEGQGQDSSTKQQPRRRHRGGTGSKKHDEARQRRLRDASSQAARVFFDVLGLAPCYTDSLMQELEARVSHRKRKRDEADDLEEAKLRNNNNNNNNNNLPVLHGGVNLADIIDLDQLDAPPQGGAVSLSASSVMIEDERQRLSCVSLLGNCVILNKRLYMLCPQAGCGRLMLLDTNKCAYNERGYACARCTYHLHKADPTHSGILLGKETWHCSVCLKAMSHNSANATFLYHVGKARLVLCSKHHTQGVEQTVTRFAQERKQRGTLDQVDNETLVSVVRAVHQATQEHVRLLYARAHKKQLAASIRNSRQSSRNNQSG